MKPVLQNLLRLQTLELGSEITPPSPKEIKELRHAIPVQVLEHHDRMRARGKKGVALVRNGVCAQCHMQVAIGLLASLLRQDDLHRCANCGAYLCAMEEPIIESPPRNVKPARRSKPRQVPATVA